MENNSIETTTKEEILNVSRRLFYEKGYRRTSFQDICREAHVYRGTIYYYYRDKSGIRFEVLQEHFTSCLRLAEKYCGDKSCAAMLAHYVQWYKFLHDPKTRRFILEYFEDEPVYRKDMGLSQFYDMAFSLEFGSLTAADKIPPISFASAYGYLAGMAHLVNACPCAYSAEKIFRECFINTAKIWNLNDDAVEKLWDTIEPCIQSLPTEEIDLSVL